MGWEIQLARRILSIRDNTTCWSGHRNYNLVVGPILLINKLVDVWGGIPPYNLLFLLFWATQFVDSGPFSNQHSVRLYRINKCCCWQHQFVDSGPFSNQHSVRLYRINKCCCWQHHLLRQTQNQQMLLLTTPFVKTDPESTNVADNKRQSINDYLAESTILLFLDILVESTILSHRGILLNFTQANSQDPSPLLPLPLSP